MVYHKSILADLLTPVAAFLKISEGVDRAFLLESVEGGEKIGRYSFIGIDPEQTFQGNLADFRRNFPESEPSLPDLPPFTGGAVGVFCYDMVRELERLPELKKKGSAGLGTETAPVRMDFYSTILAFDHVNHQILIMSHQGMDKVDELEAKLRGDVGGGGRALVSDSAKLLPLPRSSLVSEFPSTVKSDFCPGEFEAAVEKAKEYIVAGDIFQVVLSQRFEMDFKGKPFDVYRALRFVNPSPYMFFLKHGDVSIAGSSPEMLVRVQGEGLQYRPIAGTRRRGRHAVEEKRLEQELLNDEKERAEHLMLVDLGRNDLGRGFHVPGKIFPCHASGEFSQGAFASRTGPL
jgi:anthranilate synthase component I